MGTASNIYPFPANEEAAIEPMASPIHVLDDGTALTPDAFNAGMYNDVPLCVGIALGWQPAFEVGKAVLVFQGGNPSEPSGEIVATAISREGLRALVHGLRSIDARWEGA